jgi:hypothetical protein
MAPPRKTLLRPLGLVTQPNEFGWYKDGALERAINCVMRNPGELDAAPSMFSSSNTGSAGDTLYKLIPLNASHVYELSATSGDVWSVKENGSSALLPFSFISTTSLFSRTGRISPLRTKDRMLLNSNFGYLVGDNMAPTTSGERTLRLAGLPQPTLTTSGSTVPPTGGSIVPPASGLLVWGYQAIHTRTFSDGYALVSVPTPVLKQSISVGGSSRIPFVDVSWANTVAIAGDVIELYRTDGLPTTNLNADPPDVFRLVASVTLTTTDISNGFVRVNDNAKMDDAPYYTTGGRELYCNPGQGGATTINRQPPIAACTANFDGRTFYGNTTDRPRCTLQIPGGVGTSFDAARQTDFWRRHGIGTRAITGTATIGSAVITGVSATDIVGIVPGQRWYSSSAGIFNAATAFISSVNVGAGTITMNQNASASGAGSMAFADCLYIGFNGGTLSPYQFADLGDLIINLGGAGFFSPASPANQFEITSNSAFYGGSVFSTILAGQYNANLSISIEPKNHGSGFVTMQITATNAANYSPPLAEYNTTAKTFARTVSKNRLTWSKDQQPEHVPPGGAQVNETFVGLREIIAMASTRDALWIACLDGIFRLSGIGGQYRLDQIDSTKIICAPQAMDVLDESVYVYTNFGLFELDSEQRNNLTDQTIGDLLPGPQYAETNAIQVVCNETELEVLMLDVSSADRLYVYATREAGGWTTLENNTKPGPLSNITTLAFQRSTSSGDPRILVGVSPGGGTFPSYAGWGNSASFLAMDVLFQPTYQNDPVSLKQWIEASYIFDAGNAGKTLRPVWNGVAVGNSTITLYQNAAYARAGVPRDHAVAQSIQVGFDSVTTTAPQPRFLGFSVLYNPLTTQAKQRT